jgi:imidazoleglycerol phosphate synthase glutamine amidotransferase subunit HisH
MGSVLKVSIYTGSGKSNMAAFKPKISISQLLDEIETKFQRLNLHFRVPQMQWDQYKKPNNQNKVRLHNNSKLL